MAATPRFQNVQENVSVDVELTRKVAQLARLELTDDELRSYSAQLEKIVSYVGSLAEVDVSGCEPLFNPAEMESDTPLRPDQPQAPLLDEEGRPKILEAAPDTVSDGFKVPPIL